MMPPRGWSRHERGDPYDQYLSAGGPDTYSNGGSRRRAKSVHVDGPTASMPNLSRVPVNPFEFPMVAQYQSFVHGGELPPLNLTGGGGGGGGFPAMGEPGHLFIQAQQPPHFAAGYVTSPDVAFPPAPPMPSDYPPYDYGASYPPVPPPGHSNSPPPHMFAGGQRYSGHGVPGPGYSPVFPADDDDDTYSEGRQHRHLPRAHRESTARRPRAPSMHTGMTPPMSNISLPSSGSGGYPPNHRHSAAEGTLTKYSNSPPPSPRRRRSTHHNNQNRPPIHHHPTSDPPEHYYGNEVVPAGPPREHRRHRPKGSSRGRSFNDRDWESSYGDPRFSAPSLHTPEYELGPGAGYDNGYFYDQPPPPEHQHEERQSRRRQKSRPGSPVSEPARRSKSISARPRPADIITDRPMMVGGGVGSGRLPPRQDNYDRPATSGRYYDDMYTPNYPPQYPPQQYSPQQYPPQYPPQAPQAPPQPSPQQPQGILKNKRSDEKAPNPPGILKNRPRTPPSERLGPPTGGTPSNNSKSPSPKPPPRPKSSMESKAPNNNWREVAGVQPGNTFVRPDLMCAMAKFGLCSEADNDNSHNSLLRLDCGHGFHEDCLRTSIAAKERVGSAEVNLDQDKLWCDRCRDYFGKRAGQ